MDFSSLFVVLGTVPAGVAMNLAELKKAGVPVFAYGSFLTILLNFIILAFIVFMLVKQLNRFKKQAPAAAPAAVPEDVVLLREIRDALKK
jgi:large conductance mechanosensitive channel